VLARCYAPGNLNVERRIFIFKIVAMYHLIYDGFEMGKGNRRHVEFSQAVR